MYVVCLGVYIKNDILLVKNVILKRLEPFGFSTEGTQTPTVLVNCIL